MYAIMIHTTYGPGTRARAEQMADRVTQDFRTRPGFKSATFYESDATDGEYGGLVIWATKEAAEAALDASLASAHLIRDRLGLQPQRIGSHRIVEIYEPKP